MGEDLRIGLIGCGAMGQGHLDVWLQTPGARVAAVCDGYAPRALETGARIGAAAFSDLDAMLDAGGLDAVDICTPSGLHADQGLAAAKRGLHVLCEKPLDLNIEKADRLIDECEERGLTLACIFQRRTYSGAQQVARTVAEGRMGRILSCSGYVKWWRAQSYYDSSAWRGTWTMDGGVMANQAIHTLDHMCWLAGPVAEVEYAHLETAVHRMEAEDFALAVLRYESGARGVFEATTCCSPDLCARVEIFGARGSAAFEDATVVRFGLDGADRLCEIEQEAERIGGGSVPMAISMRGHSILLADFMEAVREGRKPLVSGREARMAVAALNMIYRKVFPKRKLGT
jgi:UDP-N-acetyl-2-amino-2-deoxyglucuronate dehydrogenase